MPSIQSLPHHQTIRDGVKSTINSDNVNTSHEKQGTGDK